jgi:uncharacterized protein YegL
MGVPAVEKTKVLPAYIVVDTSYSMTGDRIAAANEIVPRLIKECNKNTALADKLYVSIIAFSDSARTVVPLSKGGDLGNPPQLTAGASTSYSAAFKLLRSEIETGVITLKTNGYDVYRPVVFFITDGEPTDNDNDRAAAFAELTDSRFGAHPNIVMFGVGEAEESTLKSYTSHRGSAVIAKDGASAAEALGAMLEVLVLSVVASVGGGAEGQGGAFQIDTAFVDSDLLSVLDE